MKETIYTRSLTQAAEMQGSTQALASLLRVPENTLLRWMSGTAQMPLRAFIRVIELLCEHEKAGGRSAAPAGSPPTEALKFSLGELEARCARCDGTGFVQAAPDARLHYTSTLRCIACGEEVRHGDLIVQLAKDAVYRSKAMTAVRMKRQAQIYRPGTRMRAIRDAQAEQEAQQTEKTPKPADTQ